MNNNRSAGKLASGLILILAVMAFMPCTAMSEPASVKPDVFVQLGHSDSVRSLSFSPDGKYLVSSSSDKTVKVWEVATGKEMTSFVHGSDLLSAFFSSDGKNVWSGDAKGSLRLWDIGTGKTIAQLNHGALAYALTCSSNRKYAFTGGGERLVYWDLTTRKQVFTLPIKEVIVRDAKFSNDGRFVAMIIERFSYPNSESVIHILDVKKRKIVKKIKGGSVPLRAVALSPDGKILIAGGGNDEKDAMMSVWETDSGWKITSFPFKWPVFNVEFSPDGKDAAAASFGEVCLFDTASWTKKGTIKGELPVAFSADNRVFAHSSNWENVNGVSTYVVGIKLIDLTTGEQLKKLVRNVEWVTFSAFSSSGQEIIASGTRHSFWDLKQGKRNRAFFLKYPSGTVVYPEAESPDGKLGVEYTDLGMRLWDLEAGTMIHAFPKDGTATLNRMKFSHNGRYLLTGMWDGSVGVWDMVNRIKLRTFSGKHKNRVTALAFSQDDRFAFSSSESEDGTIKKWDVETGSLLTTYDVDQSTTSMDTSPNGTWLLAGGYNGSKNDVILWNIDTGLRVKAFKGHTERVDIVAFSHKGQYIVSGDADHMVKLWDVRTGKEVITFTGHSGLIQSLDFSSDGTRLVSAARDGTTRLWDVETGREIAQFISFADGEWIIITPEGYYSASENADRYLNVHLGRNVYGIENYRESFFRPDLVKVALEGGSLKSFRTLADVKPPPTVSIVDTPARVDTDTLSVLLRLTDNGGGIGDIRIYLNGTAVSMDSRALKKTATVTNVLLREYAVTLSSGKNTIKAVAFNGDNTMQSHEAIFDVTSTFTSATRPSLHALVIGINEFTNPKLKLAYPVADAELFADTLQQVAAGLFDTVNIRALTTTEATTSSAIIRELKAFQNLRPDDVFVFYIASHGTVDEGEYFLITSNVGSLRTDKLRTDAITQNMLKEAIANIPATKKVIIIDTCNAGALGDAIQVAMMTRGMSEDTALKILSRSVGSTILSASTSVQEAIEGYNGHGLFTYVLTEGLKGKADKGSTGFIKTTELADYVDNEVPILAEKIFKRAQYPTISISGQAFPIGKIK